MKKIIVLSCISLFTFSAFAEENFVELPIGEADPVKTEMLLLDKFIAEIDDKLKDEFIEAKKEYLKSDFTYETIKIVKKVDLEKIRNTSIQMKEKTDIIEISFDKFN